MTILTSIIQSIRDAASYHKHGQRNYEMGIISQEKAALRA